MRYADKIKNAGKKLDSKYIDLDLEGMSDDEFNKIYPKLVRGALYRGVLGILIVVLGIIGLVMGGRYLW